MREITAHCGVAQSDPRNIGPIAFFKPKPVTASSVRERLTSVSRNVSPEEIETRVRQLMKRIATGPVRPPPPLSQSLADVNDPLYGLGTHPDIIERMWKIEALLPRHCRWVFWGLPALVHPATGVVFAVGYGTIGYVMRLPVNMLKNLDLKDAAIVVKGNPGQTFDIGPAGPERRFVLHGAPEIDWALAAFYSASLASL